MSLQIEQNFNAAYNPAARMASRTSSRGYSPYPQQENYQNFQPNYFQGGFQQGYAPMSYQFTGSRQLQGSGNNNQGYYYQNQQLPFYGYQNQGIF